MVKKISEILNGSLSVLLYGINTLLWAFPMLIVAVLKFLIPINIFSNICRSIMNDFVNMWVFCNKINQKIFSRIFWDIKGLEQLKMDKWYIVIANHQSWVDILTLQSIFHNKIPCLKFFIKKELLWFPILGQIWWALEFPFLNRKVKHTHKSQKTKITAIEDLENIKKSCQKLRKVPVSITNFVEGTRFSYKKHFSQKSEYANLLRAKSGGLSYALNAMNGYLHQIIDVTIAYPSMKKSFWNFTCGQTEEIRVRVNVRSIKENMFGNYLKDLSYRKSFQIWLNSIWMEKDKHLNYLLNK